MRLTLLLVWPLVICYPKTLAAEGQKGAGFRFVELAPPLAGQTGFSLQPPNQTGVVFTNVLALERHLTNQIYLNGSGVAAGDVDGDGLVDLYFCRLGGPNALYRNLGGWRFEDMTDRAGVGCAGLDSSSAVLADVDGDGDLDLLVSSVGGGTHLFLNDGKGHFTQSSVGLLNGIAGATSMAMADLDGNGTLDLYIANYRTVTLRDQPNTAFKLRMVNGQPEVASINGRSITEPDLVNRFEFKIGGGAQRGSFSSDENGEPDAIYLNDGHGRFTKLSFTNGAFLDEDGRALVKPPFDWGLSVMLRDLNGDGRPDIYVCNDFKSPDRVWLNDGQGRFRALPRVALRQTPLSSMGVDVADINRDGHFDIFVVDMLSREHQHRMTQRSDVNPQQIPVGDTTTRLQTPRNTLQLSRGDGTFAEIAQFAGLSAAEWAWTPVFLDVDLDGYEDLLISNGFERDGMNADVLREIEARKTAQKLPPVEQLGLRRLFPRLDTPNAAFRNLGDLRFADVSAAWGFNARAVSQGLALADLDNDGDLDVVINNLNGPAMLYRNNSPAPRVAVRLQGEAPNTHGIGAKITATGGPVMQSQEMICGGRYLSSDEAMRVFAAGSLTNQLRIEIAWRSGKKSIVAGAKPNHLYVIEESGAETPQPEVQRSPVPTLFEEVSSLLSHRPTEEWFDDFARQPLLPYRLSQPGPGVSWFDVDGDGREDLILASGRGGRTGVFLNQPKGAWKRMDRPPFDSEITHDQTAVLGWRRSSNEVVLLAGSSHYEGGSSQGGAVRQFDLARGRVTEILPGAASSTGPLALADVDGDGTLDLFVGGRVLPGKYPEPASSGLFRSGPGGLILDDAAASVLAGVGLVNGAVFSDIDGDGDPDLVLACDWGPLKLFRNESGKFSPWNPRLTGVSLHPQLATLNTLTGWWNGITTGDFDGDGRLDWVASNGGENTRHEMFRAQPLRLYHGDFDGDGVVEIIEAHYEPSLKAYAPSRNLEAILRGMPALRSRFPTWKSFSEASVEQLLGDKLPAAKVLEARWLATTVFLNRGDHFEVVRLPDEAQFAPAFGISVADFDGDGAEDIFLAQNFFATPSDSSRQDAGRGLLLRGDGRGGFRAVPGQESGLILYGEQRGAAAADYDGDGRVDLCVGQTGAETKLYHNEHAHPGLRVRLQGPPQNASAIGAVLRPVFVNGRMGAARELHAGSGWLSQESAVSVFAGPEAVKSISIRWPGGKTTQTEIAPGAREVILDSSGQLTRVR